MFGVIVKQRLRALRFYVVLFSEVQQKVISAPGFHLINLFYDETNIIMYENVNITDTLVKLLLNTYFKSFRFYLSKRVF